MLPLPQSRDFKCHQVQCFKWLWESNLVPHARKHFTISPPFLSFQLYPELSINNKKGNKQMKSLLLMMRKRTKGKGPSTSPLFVPGGDRNLSRRPTETTNAGTWGLSETEISTEVHAWSGPPHTCNPQAAWSSHRVPGGWRECCF